VGSRVGFQKKKKKKKKSFGQIDNIKQHRPISPSPQFTQGETAGEDYVSSTPKGWNDVDHTSLSACFLCQQWYTSPAMQRAASLERGSEAAPAPPGRKAGLPPDLTAPASGWPRIPDTVHINAGNGVCV
jgi:hypothetical protein